MYLTLTQHIDASPDAVMTALSDETIDLGLHAAANRLRDAPGEVAISRDEHAVHIEAGVDVLAGAEVRVGGVNRLARVEISVPWTSTDHDGRKFLAANSFADTLGREVRAAA